MHTQPPPPSPLTADAAPSPLVTFIVPAYNVEDSLLRACLQSIIDLPLTPDQREIIVIDDGSDCSPELLVRRLCPTAIFRRIPHGGLSRARNAAIPLAHGTYIQFIDADDALIPHAYTAVLQLLHTRPDLIFFEHTRSEKSAASPLSSGRGGQGGEAFMLHHNLRAAAWGYIFRREILGSLRFLPDLLHEDELFTPQLLLRARRVLVSPAVAYFYRLGPGTITTRRDSAHRQRRLDDLLRVIGLLQEQAAALPDPGQRRALTRRVHQLAMDHIYTTLTLTPTSGEALQHINRLRPLGLYPLPARRYTLKYTLFRLLTARPAGLRLLHALLKE